jgi:hypothetical protein
VRQLSRKGIGSAEVSKQVVSSLEACGVKSPRLQHNFGDSLKPIGNKEILVMLLYFLVFCAICFYITYKISDLRH